MLCVMCVSLVILVLVFDIIKQAITVLHGDFKAPWQFAHQKNCKWENQPRVIVIAFIEHSALSISHSNNKLNRLKLWHAIQMGNSETFIHIKVVLSFQGSFLRPAKRNWTCFEPGQILFENKRLEIVALPELKGKTFPFYIFYPPFNISSSVKWVEVDVSKSVQAEIELTFSFYKKSLVFIWYWHTIL